MLQLALSARDAQSYHRLVSAYGSGVCTTYPGLVEDLQYMVVH